MPAPTRTFRRATLVAVVATLAAALIASCGRPPGDDAAAATCVGSTSAADLAAVFDQKPGGLFAADYQRAIPLPDGRTLWLFQDASIELPPLPEPATTTTTLPGTPEPPPPEPRTKLVHNAALIQTGTCFDLLRGGTAENPLPWLLAGETAAFSHWFWPLDASIGADGQLYVFLAEMVENGPLYLSSTEPIGTRVVAIDVGSLRPTWSGRPADASPSLYGFSITSDASWTYLYAQCHRQFGYDLILLPAHDLDCAAAVTVARVPKGRMLQPPTYWDGSSWQADPARAVPVIPMAGRSINPSQVRWTGSGFVAVTKVGDWFGTTVFLDRAPAAQGPWQTYARIRVDPKCDPLECNTYFASWVPTSMTGSRWMIGLSNNRWDGAVSEINRPTFLVVPPPGQFSLAARCSRVQC